MTATLSQVRTALATTLSAVSGLAVHAFKPGSITPPAAVIMPAPGDFITYRVTMDAASDLDLVIGLFVQWGEDQSVNEAIDAFIAHTGTQSIVAAVDADQTLGGVVSQAWVETARDYGEYSYAGQPYYGCVFPVSVILL